MQVPRYTRNYALKTTQSTYACRQLCMHIALIAYMKIHIDTGVHISSYIHMYCILVVQNSNTYYVASGSEIDA